MPEPEQKVIPVRVALRCRPLISKEVTEGCQECLKFVKDEPQVIIGKNKAFTYDYVFQPTDPQEDVYENGLKSLVDNIFKGYNATILAYGQTGSGKTFTMGGCYEDSLSGDEMMMGVIPRVLRDIFRGIDQKDEFDFVVRISYLEIYNEDLIDLLCPRSKREPVSIREDSSGGIRLQGLREILVGSFDETLGLLENGSRGRTTGATAMNSTSSRSHAIFTIHIDQTRKEDINDMCHVKFHLVDLAGSERAKRTHTEGERFREGVNINMGLLALGNVISALGEETQKRNHIPYRDSKLTRILQDSLGGNSHTVMVACVSPADSNMEETLNTLRYADRARKIKNKPIINRDPQAAEILRLQQVVQQLLLQQGGGAGSLPLSSSIHLSATLECSSSSSSVEQTKLVKKNTELLEENSKLGKELQHSVDQCTHLCERVIILEASRDKLKDKIKELKQQTGLDLEVLSSSMDSNSNPQAKEQLELIRKLTENIKSVASDEDQSVFDENDQSEQLSSKKPGGKSRTHRQEEDMGDVPNTPQSNAITTQHALSQAMMGRELQELNRLLEKKEVLANQIYQNDTKMDSMRMQYQNALKDLENEVSALQNEKDELQSALNNAKTNSAANKISEQRRKRLQELEQQISQLKRKMTEQTKIVKLKNQSDKQVTKLNGEIQALKQQRVKLMKQMKEDSETFRKWKQQKDKEVLQLMQKDRKRQCEIAKLQKVNEKQQTVLRRKAEEAAAANRRLKDAMAKHKAVMNERANKLQKYDSSGIGNRVREWLNHELEVRVSVREAKYHLDSLLKDRKILTAELLHLEQTLEEGPPKKRMAWTGQGESFEKSLEEEDMVKRIDVLKQDVELRNAQISDLQQKILDAEQDGKGKATWDNLHTMVEAKCALKWLLEQAVSAKADISTAKEELKDVKESYEDVSQTSTKFENEMKQSKQAHQEELTEMQRQYEDKILFLLKHQVKPDQKNIDVLLDNETKKRLNFQEKEIEKLCSISEELERKTEQCDNLKKQLTMAVYQGKRVSLMPGIRSPGGSPFTPLFPAATCTKMKKPTDKVKEESVQNTSMTYEEFMDDWESETEDLSFEDDEKKDPAWRLTPFHKRSRSVAAPKRPSSESNPCCRCKGSCTTKRCQCVKGDRPCEEGTCGCLTDKCSNRKKETPESTTGNESARNSTQESTMNTTFSLDTTDTPTGGGVTSTSVTENSINKRPSKARRNRRAILSVVQPDELNSSEEFEKSSFKIPAVQEADSSDPIQGGIKKKRKLLSSQSSSFFSPLID